VRRVEAARSSDSSDADAPTPRPASSGALHRAFSSISHLLSRWMGSHWAVAVAAVVIAVGLGTVGIVVTALAIAVVTLLMVFVLQNTQNRDTAAIHLKLDEIITQLEGPRNEIAGAESRTHAELDEMRKPPED
jgi:low affinity Fe/Cu permease